MIILGVDPGKMTGWAAFDTLAAEGPHSGQLDREEFVDFIVPRLEHPTQPRLMIACERFTISGGTVTKGRTDENWSIEQIGILRHWARRFGHEFTLQSAGDAKKFATNDKLKLVGWHRPRRDHENDALRHTLLRLATADHGRFAALLDAGQHRLLG